MPVFQKVLVANLGAIAALAQALLRILESAEFRAGDVHTGLATEVLGRTP